MKQRLFCLSENNSSDGKKRSDYFRGGTENWIDLPSFSWASGLTENQCLSVDSMLVTKLNRHEDKKEDISALFKKHPSFKSRYENFLTAVVKLQGTCSLEEKLRQT